MLLYPFPHVSYQKKPTKSVLSRAKLHLTLGHAIPEKRTNVQLGARSYLFSQLTPPRTGALALPPCRGDAEPRSARRNVQSRSRM